MFNRVHGIGRGMLRFIRLVWRDGQAMSVILLAVSAAMIGFCAIIEYRSQNPVVAMIDAALSGTQMGFAIFSAINLFHRQAARDHFEQWWGAKFGEFGVCSVLNGV